MTKKSKPILNPAALKAAFETLHLDTQKPNKTSGSRPLTHPKHPLALVMMVKNEEKRIEVSFDSVKEICNTFVILDTGSTDRTIEICKTYCKKHNITLHLKEAPFVNFCVSRNVLLDFADEVLVDKNKPDLHYLLLLDCNDELRNVDELKLFMETYQDKATGFHLKQQWWTASASLDTYYNIRMVLSHQNWRYKGVVHEYICQPKEIPNSVLTLENVILFQDRTKDDDKSMKRFSRDKDMLYPEYLKNPSEPRTVFYLAQTCGCLGQHSEAYLYYYERTKLGGFTEEQFHGYYRLGELSSILGHPWEESLNWYLKAFYHSSRVEPLIRIIDHYLRTNPLKELNEKGEEKADFVSAYMYASIACKMLYPHKQILFVDRQAYLYKRWHLLGRIAFYVGRYKEGKEACIKALMAEPDSKVDQDNLQFYLRKLEEVHLQLGHQNLVFPSSLYISTENGEIGIDKEEGAGVGIKASKEDILRQALIRYTQESKGFKK